MKVSIIIPIYKGNSYIPSLLKMIDNNVNNCKEEIEVLFINDYPQDTLLITGNHNYDIKVINNVINQGIHQSRVNGLNKARGKYILFLDQDDEISDYYLESQLSLIHDGDLCICNGIMESSDSNCLIYKNNRSQDYLTKQIGFIKVRDLIVSPGQCLIKKDSIPDYWLNNVMSVNSADDYYLWLLMINDKRKFVVNHNVLYTHKYTGENVSGSIDQVHKSNLEMVELLKGYCKSLDIKLLKRTIVYKYDMKQNGKLIPSIKNLDLFIYNCLYQLLWKGM